MKKNPNSKAFKLVKTIYDGKNVDAYKMLEQVMKEKLADKIDNATKNQ